MKKYAIVFASLVLLALPVDALALAAGSTGFGYLRLDEQSSNPATAPSSKVYLFIDNTSTPVLKMIDDAGTVTSITAGSGDNTLDKAYDQGGAGSGAKIVADSGIVEIEVTDGSGNGALLLDSDEATNDNTVFQITNAADAAGAISIDVDAQTTGRDFEGTGASSYITGLGLIYAAGGLLGDGQADAVGFSSVVENYTGAGNTITIAESGSVFTNATDGDGSLHTLPEASTAIGCVYTFVVFAAQNLVVELDNADRFLHLTLDAGDQIQSATVNDTITVMAVGDNEWAILSVYPLAADWADGGS